MRAVATLARSSGKGPSTIFASQSLELVFQKCSLIIQQQTLQSLGAPKFAQRRHGNIDLPLHCLFDMCRCSAEGELNGHQLFFPLHAAAFRKKKKVLQNTAEISVILLRLKRRTYPKPTCSPQLRLRDLLLM